MGKKSNKVYIEEFPLLQSLGLYAASTKGDGNCLFRALSDQVYGDDSHHFRIRQQVMDYVKEHEGHFSAFVGEYGETFDQYVSRLVQDGVYGGHIEIVGFADVFKKPVVIYQAETLYILEPQSSPKREWDGSAHIAYHTWEHYSSVRKIGGPQNGPTEIDIPSQVSLPDSTQDDGSSAEAIPPWKMKIVMNSVPDAPKQVVREMLLKKDYELVIEELLMKEFEDENLEDSMPTSASLPQSGTGMETPKTPSDKSQEEPNKETSSHALSQDAIPAIPANDAKKGSRTKKESKSSRKEESKAKRAEKRERVRAKKDRSKRDNMRQGEGGDQKPENTSIDAHRIIHI